MDYESKYKDAFERARKIHKYSSDLAEIKRMEHIFPELKESEDEKIRKALIEYFGEQCDMSDWNGVYGYQVVAWLEKQQKPADKDEPKFHEGDWVVDEDDNSIHQIKRVIENVTSGNFSYDLVGGGYFPSTKKNYHLWSVKDAKDGDVLKEDSCIFIIKRMKPNGTAIVHCCLFDDGDFDLGSTLGFDVDSTHPATKEQRDFLFQKMKESGYEWDAKNKELNKIHIIDEGKAEMDYCFTKMMNGEKVNPTWSEEDEYMLNETIQHLEELIRIDKAHHLGCDVQYYQRDIDWLNTIKERVGR